MSSTMSKKELIEISKYIVSVMTKEEKRNFSKMTDLEKGSIIEKYLEEKG